MKEALYAGAAETVLNELNNRVLQEPTSENWRDKLAWLNAVEVMTFLYSKLW